MTGKYLQKLLRMPQLKIANDYESNLNFINFQKNEEEIEGEEKENQQRKNGEEIEEINRKSLENIKRELSLANLQFKLSNF